MPDTIILALVMQLVTMFSMSATTKAMQVGYKYNINLFKQNVLVYPYKFDESISNLGGPGWH